MVLGPEPVAGDTTTLVADEPLLAEGARTIEGRSLGRIAWNRLKRDRVAMAGGAVVIVLILVAVFSQLIIKYLGHPPNAFNQKQISAELGTPLGKYGGISWSHPLGLEPQNGRDLFSRIVYGSWNSLLIASLATLLSVVAFNLFGDGLRDALDPRAR